MFMTMFFSAWTVLHLYVFWRLASIPFVVQRVSRKFLVVTAAILWASFLLRRFMDNEGMATLARPLELFGMNWLGTLFLVFCCLLVVDVITVFGLVLRRHGPALRGVALVAGIVLAAVAFAQGLRPPVVHDYEVRLADLPVEDDGLVIAVISDLHVGRFLDGEWLAARIEQVRALQPDLVIMLGDLFEGDSQSERQVGMTDILRALSPPYGVWAVTGNHESHGGRDASVRFLEDAGVHVLRNEWIEVRPGLVIGGVEDGGHQESSTGSADRVRQVLASKPLGAAAVFLSHRPQMFDEAASAGVGLMLCGHTHGGQIWPFSYVVGLMNPLLAGRYEMGGMPVIVSRGTGTWGPRMRLWAPGEILRITMHPLLTNVESNASYGLNSRVHTKARQGRGACSE
ncbi:MAG TPA: metallophosphoesterase [Sedimentisphaerales bacterium]|nr:metallophosphoesterase [Sedimentisphaerales bacterium]